MQAVSDVESRVTEGDRIEALGVPITLVDGRQVRLRFGARAIRQLERQYGSLKTFQEEIRSGSDGRGATAIFDALGAGLLHEKLGSQEEVDDLLDERLLSSDYLTAFNEAWEQSQPPEDAGPVQESTTSDPGESRGVISTISSPSNSVEPKANSGT